MVKIIENYSLQDLIGSGSHSQVYKAINTKTNEVFAIKMIKSDKFKQIPKLQQTTVNDINILTTFRPCTYIIRYYDMLKTVNNYYFIFEFCNGGTLQQLLQSVQYIPQRQSLIYFRQMIQAIKNLIERNIILRGLRPKKILLHNGIIKIPDCFLSKALQNIESPSYMAPEILRGETYTIKADIWSLGVIFFRMLFGYFPYQSSHVTEPIKQNDELFIPSEPQISPILVQLIKRMLVKNPQKRADWNQVFNYQISQNGQIKQIRDVNLSQEKTQYGHCMLTMNRYEDNQGGSSKVIRPHQIISTPFNSRQQIEEKGLSFQRHKINREQYFQNVRDKYPYQYHNSKTQIYYKNHTKCLQLIKLSLEVYGYQNQYSLSVAYLIGKQLQKQYNQLIQSINYGYDYDIYKLFCEEAQELKYILTMYCQQLIDKQIEYYCLEDRSNQVIKQFINSLKFQTLEETIMVERILAWLNQLNIKKNAYQKIQQQQQKGHIIRKHSQF